MADGGPNGDGCINGEGRRENNEHPTLPSSLSPKGPGTNGTKRHLPRGIVIQLTGTEGEWDSLDESELIFSLDHDEDYPTISLTRECQLSVGDDLLLHTPPCNVPLSPSTPSSLGNCSGPSHSFLSPGPSSPTHRPLSNLVKSLSSELEIKEGATLRPKPLLSLVKSISTESSRSEPEISQSKSDSRLNLHLWKQLTQPKNRSNGDSRTAPPSPSAISPSGDGGKGSFFKMELEDTKRKFSEAVHEPFSSMFHKIMREESGGSPKHQCKNQAVLSRSMAQDVSTDSSVLESPGKKKSEGEILHIFEWPPFKHHRRTCPVHHNRQPQRDEELEVFSDGDVMQISVTETGQPPSSPPILDKPPFRTPIPRMSLFCVGVLSYGYFILPLSSYFSGLALGLAMGFFLGLLFIRMESTKSHSSVHSHRKPHSMLGEAILTGATVRTESSTLKGWMREVYEYDPETHHVSQSHSVFASVEGVTLRLDSPRNNISRRATYGERPHDNTFVKSRSFQLTNSKVFLLPYVLAQKRIWNPKYPICIQLGSQEEAEERLEEHIPKEEPSIHPKPTILYLFGRTGREKEEWYRHFLLASVEAQRAGRCVGRSGDVHSAPAPAVTPHWPVPNSRGSSRVGSCEEDSTPPVSSQTHAHVPQSSSGGQSVLDYYSYMNHLLSTVELTPLCSPNSTAASPTIKGHCTCDIADYPGRSHTAWINALIGRIFWDFLREKYWADLVSNKIQKKLSKIRLPYFMNELTLTEMDLGTSMPLITATSRPEINPRGLWVELQLVYTGALQMTLQTKFNLSKLGKEGGQETDCTPDTKNTRCRPILSVLADSDEESSSAGSSDEEELLLSEPQGPVAEKGATATNDGAGGGKTGRKILRFVDKIAKSKYFQKAAENEFIKKKFEEMSNTPLLLTVEVQELSGTLVINIPPPPTDRIWYSFCSPPKLDLHVRPKLGEREVTFCHVTEWIEKKLQEEFQKVFVLPNMDDIQLPLMHSGLDSPQSQRSHSLSTESIEKIAAESN